jgi:hypothetical protein
MITGHPARDPLRYCLRSAAGKGCFRQSIKATSAPRSRLACRLHDVCSVVGDLAMTRRRVGASRRIAKESISPILQSRQEFQSCAQGTIIIARNLSSIGEAADDLDNERQLPKSAFVASGGMAAAWAARRALATPASAQCAPAGRPTTTRRQPPTPCIRASVANC